MRHTILIVDDDTLILNTLKGRFDNWDMDVYVAADPNTAKSVMEQFPPEIILLDLLLTKADGANDILDFMQSKEALKQIPVIVLTNLDKPDLKEVMLKQGVKEYLIKGKISLDELYEKVMGYLEPPKS